eukprot:696775-Prymnesium_polylepis.1
MLSALVAGHRGRASRAAGGRGVLKRAQPCPQGVSQIRSKRSKRLITVVHICIKQNQHEFTGNRFSTVRQPAREKRALL